MAAFSRLQLAAALLEYDNDPSDSSVPQRSAHDSAIFAHLRRLPRPPSAPRRSNDYLGVSLPSETGSLGGRESVLGDTRSRASRGSVDILRNPFGEEVVDDDGPTAEDAEDLEVDLASWGLDSFMPKEKRSKASRDKSKFNTVPVTSLRSPQDSMFDPAKDRIAGKRSMTISNVDRSATEGTFLDGPQLGDNRRRSIGGPLESTSEAVQPPVHRRHISSHALIENLHAAPNVDSVPFPTGPYRSESPLPDKRPRPSSHVSALQVDPQLRQSHSRTYSSASMEPRLVLGEADQNRLSQLDTKHNRTLSQGTTGTPMDENPFALRPPSRASKFDPKAAAHARTLSNASLGSRMMLDDDKGSVMTGFSRGRPYSTMDLLRPKVLVMPSPLQPIEQASVPEPVKPRDGFQLSTNGPPLPPGARSGRRSSALLSALEASSNLDVPAPSSNLLTPNPRISLTLSQLTFRNSLMVGGQRDVAYSDIDNALPRAVEEGEQVHGEESDDDELPVVRAPVAEEPRRPAGKLYGKSLIDDLEDRKAQLRGKQRVFFGDDRPSMMARGQLQRSNTLIDPASLQAPPSAQHPNPLGSSRSRDALGRRSSAMKPLLSFDDDKVPKLSPEPRMPKSRSVFGVDTLWEREMTKLKEIEIQEEREAEELRRREAEEADRARKKREKRKGKAKSDDVESIPSPVLEAEAEPRVSAEPPVLPVIRKATLRQPHPAVDDDDESDSDHSGGDDPSRDHISSGTGAEHWYNDSSDEADDGPRRTTGTGPRYLKSANRPSRMTSGDDDSDEDVPLAATFVRATQRAIRVGLMGHDSDDEKPLSSLIEKTKLGLPPIDFDAPADPKTDDDDDDKPLGLRVPLSSHGPSSISQNNGDDDDRPLGFHPEHQRRTQYNMMATQQHQNQMMMQAQMHGSVFFGPQPAMLGSGFFGQPMGAPMMIGPFPSPAMPSPPPVEDAAKFGRVDRWRHKVAVEGQR